MHITVDLHLRDDRDLAILRDIQKSVAALVTEGRTIMTKFDDLSDKLAAIQTGLDEVNSDLDAILAKLAEAGTDGLTAEQTAAITALVTDVQGRVSTAAGKYTPPVPPV
jgi:ActR/RegA family two-component response regulator